MTESLDVWAFPLATWGLAQLVTGLSVALIPPSSGFRSVATGVVIALAASFQTQVRESIEESRIGGPLVAMCWVNVLNAIDLLVLTRVSYDAQLQWQRRRNGKKQKQLVGSPTDALVENLVWSQTVAFNYRRIGTPWEIRGLPNFHGEGVPSRGKYILGCAGKLCASVLVLYLFTIEADDPQLLRVIDEVSESKVVLLPWVRFTLRGRLIQCLFTVSFAIVCRSALLAGYSLAAVLAVGLGVHEPAEWPPLANSLFESWSLRRLWGTGWHQLLRKLLTSNADFLTSSILCIPRNSPWGRYVSLLFTFVLSGMFHMQMDLAFGVPLEKSGAIYFFTLQAFGVVLEGAVQYVFQGRIARMSPLSRRAIGYVWVVVFLLWTLPVWLNPINLRLLDDGQRLISPLPVFSRLV